MQHCIESYCQKFQIFNIKTSSIFERIMSIFERIMSINNRLVLPERLQNIEILICQRKMKTKIEIQTKLIFRKSKTIVGQLQF